MERASSANASYWSQSRRPLPCLVFVLPILVAYEVGVWWVGAGAGAGAENASAVRAGADLWVRAGLGGLGLTDRWLPPLIIVLALLAWQVADARQWRFAPTYLAGMALESLAFAGVLVVLSKLLDLGFRRLDQAGSGVLQAGGGSGGTLATLVGFLGAGVYEEALFRLALVPLALAVLRFLHVPKLPAGTLAVTGSALLFAIAHHVGASEHEAFSWYVFVFRWGAGVYFAWLFVARGFGVAVGAHTLYDILVGWPGSHA